MFGFDIKQRQVNNVAMITFWSQFAAYSINSVLILFLTRPIWKHGLGYHEDHAYAFFGVYQAMGYLMPVLGGFMADKVLGIRRSILIGSALVAAAYLLVMLSGYTVKYGDYFFIAAYALIPATNSLLMGTSSAMIARIFSDSPSRAKAGVTIYYMSINLGALLATFLAPMLMKSVYGPLTVFAVAFAGKALSVLNFAWRYNLYDKIIEGQDKKRLNFLIVSKVISYLLVIYIATVIAYFNVNWASLIMGFGCTFGLLWFLGAGIIRQGDVRFKHMIALALIIEAVVFFILYNQMGSTLVLFAQNNSDLNLLGFHVSAAQYQMINPIAIMLFSFILPYFYRIFPNFNIPYQFAAGTALAGIAMLVMWVACYHATNGLINGNYFILSYFIQALAELWVSAIGLSMIGFYCDHKIITFSMGAWYIAVSLSHVLSGQLARFVAINPKITNPVESLPIYQSYYFKMAIAAIIIGIIMIGFALLMKKLANKRDIILH